MRSPRCAASVPPWRRRSWRACATSLVSPASTREDPMVTEPEQQEMLIVTGMSGAGRSTVGNALEDLGWYVVDNLPPQMLVPLIDVAEHAGESLPRIAVVVDVRGGVLFNELRDLVQQP